MNALRDWGHAKDYVYMQWLMLQQESPDDFVIATGKQYSVRDFVIAASRELEMDLTWSGEGLDEKAHIDGNCVVQVDRKYFRPTEVETLLGSSEKAKEKLGWVPKVSFKELVAEMARADFELAKKDLLLNENGFAAPNYNE